MQSAVEQVRPLGAPALPVALVRQAAEVRRVARERPVELVALEGVARSFLPNQRARDAERNEASTLALRGRTCATRGSSTRFALCLSAAVVLRSSGAAGEFPPAIAAFHAL